MQHRNKWKEPAELYTSPPILSSVQRVSDYRVSPLKQLHVVESEHIPDESVVDPFEPPPINNSLLSTLKDHGFDEIDAVTLSHCPDSILSVLWRLISDKQSYMRKLTDEQDKYARISNDNKLVKLRNSKLADQIARLEEKIENLQAASNRREIETKSRIDEIERNRNEWEKCAIAYKSRESRFVAEIRKHENEYQRFHSQVTSTVSRRRGISVGSDRPPPIFN